jgi:hypothetical protein
MTLHSPVNMAEATRLTIAGRLEEAMAIIQQLNQMPQSYEVPEWFLLVGREPRRILYRPPRTRC